MRNKLHLSNSANGSDAAGADAAIAEKQLKARAMLINEFRIESAFIDVPKLSRVLGIAPSTIYSYIRNGDFFIPHRLLHGKAVVSLDDLVEWYCAPIGSARPPS